MIFPHEWGNYGEKAPWYPGLIHSHNPTNEMLANLCQYSEFGVINSRVVNNIPHVVQKMAGSAGPK